MCQDGWREAEDVGGKGGSKGPSSLSWDLNFDRKAMVRILEGSDLLRYELLKTLGQLEGYTGRRVRAEGEQEPPFLLPSSYPRVVHSWLQCWPLCTQAWVLCSFI